jgi:CRP-like cAMP-binding protein
VALDVALDVVVDDGGPVAELTQGASLGERAVLEGGTRIATLHALTPCAVAVARADQVDCAALEELSQDHRREEARSDPRLASDPMIGLDASTVAAALARHLPGPVQVEGLRRLSGGASREIGRAHV